MICTEVQFNLMLQNVPRSKSPAGSTGFSPQFDSPGSVNRRDRILVIKSWKSWTVTHGYRQQLLRIPNEHELPDSRQRRRLLSWTAKQVNFQELLRTVSCDIHNFPVLKGTPWAVREEEGNQRGTKFLLTGTEFGTA